MGCPFLWAVVCGEQKGAAVRPKRSRPEGAPASHHRPRGAKAALLLSGQPMGAAHGHVAEAAQGLAAAPHEDGEALVGRGLDAIREACISRVRISLRGAVLFAIERGAKDTGCASCTTLEARSAAAAWPDPCCRGGVGHCGGGWSGALGLDLAGVSGHPAPGLIFAMALGMSFPPLMNSSSTTTPVQGSLLQSE